MTKFRARHIIAMAVLLLLFFAWTSRFFEGPENVYKSAVARQKLNGIIQSKSTETPEPDGETMLMVNDTLQRVYTKFADQLYVGDSVVKIIYELKATVYKPNGGIVTYDLMTNKPIKK